MKKIYTIFCLACTVVAQAWSAAEPGVYNGTLTIDGTAYTNELIYLLPGTEPNTVTCVAGEQVWVNLPQSAFSLSAQPTNKNYDFVNGGFEGNWSNNEPSGWHSFGTATGTFASFVKGNTHQFTQSTDVRPGSTGSNSALLKSNIVLGTKANGNCTNGQINAGSTSASDGSKNYNFSDPSNSGYNTAFAGQPDSLVFWAKYIPADQNPSNASNKARAHAVITTNARYQDPESSDYSSVKIGDAQINYAATSSMGWQRLSAPFTYYSVSPDQAAYMLMTFTTNVTPGGGTTTNSSVDNIYLDDVQMIYNYGLKGATLEGQALSFSNGQASVALPFSTDYEWNVTTDATGAHVFIGYDAASYKAYLYVVAGNYARAHNYTVYTVQMTESAGENDTYYQYAVTVCGGQPYSDDLFQDLTETGSYTTRIPNTQGGDSVITLELTVNPSYLFEEQLYISDEEIDWRGHHIAGLAYADEPYIYADSLLTTAGCDSIYRLLLYVSAVPHTYGVYTAKACAGDSVEFEGVYYAEPFEGDIQLAQPNQYGGDSIVHLTVQILPNYSIEDYMTIRQGESRTWEGIQLSSLPAGTVTMNASYYSIDDCDSIRVLHLTVLSTSKPWTGTDTMSVNRVLGRYDGELNIGGTAYADKSVFVLPGTVDSTITFVLPDFTFNGGKLGHIVLPNIPMSVYGQLMLEDRTLYLDTISERATITLINGYREGTKTHYSVLANDQAEVMLYIEAPSLPQAILVTFQGDAVRHNNYAVNNGGFEGNWSNNEPAGWHSFGSATGEMADFVSSNVHQFVYSNDVRPGSNGTQSAMISSNIILSVKANGNCTNGQIHAASMTADNAESNYNFSDPANTGFNTPFHGRPDSLVFWTKYLPADRNAANELNKARMSTVITTDARYQDPETGDYAAAKIGAATINYSAADMNWQRIAVPFTYTATDNQPAYILTTFTTNEQPGGGTSYTTTGSNRVNVLDTVWLDDVEVVYNKQLRAFYHGADELSFDQYVAHVNDTYCDDCASYEAYGNGVSAQTFMAFDAEHRCITVYVIADDYAQTLDYMLYRIEFADSQTADLQPIDPSQDIETVRTQQGGYEKVLYNGQLYIRQGDNWYTISGIKIK